MSRRRAAALLALTLAGASAAGMLFWLGVTHTKPSHPAEPNSHLPAARTATRRTAAEAARLRVALAKGVRRAARLGGAVEAAAMLDRWRVPLIETSDARGPTRYMRMWSMSKVAAMIAVLRGLGWGERPGRPIPAELAAALRGAITRSENCRQRRVVLEIQRLNGGTRAATATIAGVFRAAGAGARVDTATETPESLCVPYLDTQSEIPDPLAPALLLGTSTWRVGDAVRLVHALSIGTYGRAVSRGVLGLMRAPKLASRESPPGELTADVDWGAGNAMAGLEPAYKAGWGGSQHGNFLAGQIALVTIPGGGHVAIAVMFHPSEQPSRDDPGITVAPAAIELVMRSLRRSFAPEPQSRPR